VTTLAWAIRKRETVPALNVELTLGVFLFLAAVVAGII
jgi:hypothetical protein